MTPTYQDIIARAGPPSWWGPGGVPRYGDFDPAGLDVYADQAVLYEVACQGCGERFRVAEAWASGRAALRAAERTPGQVPTWADVLDSSPRAGLERGEPPFYGDPPNVECCPSGPTMTALFVRLLEYHERAPGMDWRRVPEVEALELPDETEDDEPEGVDPWQALDELVLGAVPTLARMVSEDPAEAQVVIEGVDVEGVPRREVLTVGPEPAEAEFAYRSVGWPPRKLDDIPPGVLAERHDYAPRPANFGEVEAPVEVADLGLKPEDFAAGLAIDFEPDPDNPGEARAVTTYTAAELELWRSMGLGVCGCCGAPQRPDGGQDHDPECHWARLPADYPTGSALCFHCGVRVDGLPLGTLAVCPSCKGKADG